MSTTDRRTERPAVRSSWVKIGMEIHVELATRSKMFTRAANLAHPDHLGAAPNTLVDPVVMGLPGALPVMNRAAVEMSMRVGLALQCTIPELCVWDRKNYFYPDLPKGYQISQYELPLCVDGYLDITRADGSEQRVGIIRAHLEEDAGKLGHELPGGAPYDGSLIDLNRAGTPLLEIVTAPDLASAEDAAIFARELHRLCRFIGVTVGDMQRGHMRFEPNVNVIIETDDGRTVATPIVEMKNLNSFRAVQAAIEHEQVRQVHAWEQDGREHGPGMKVTRGWDDERGRTFVQREKEDEDDYRYFPDPDLVPVRIDAAWREQVAAALPELPRERRRRYETEYDLGDREAEVLVADRELCLFFEACVDAYHRLTGTEVPSMHAGQQAAKILLNAGAKRANEQGTEIHALGVAPEQVAGLIVLRDEGTVGSSAADTLFGLLCERDGDARSIAEVERLVQVSDAGRLDEWIAQAIEAQPQAAADFAAGKDAAVGRLVGEVMKRSGGQADAKAVRDKLVEVLR